MTKIDPKIHRHIVVDLINTFAPSGVGIEIGVKKAKTSSVILRDTTIQHIFLIDPWHKRKREWLRAAKFSQSLPERVTVIRKRSEDATKDIPNELDFIWIDGDHSYNFVMKDLTLWIPKVRSSGLVIGHDWGKRFPDVKRAVVDYAKSHPFAPLTEDYINLKHSHLQAPKTNPVVNVSEHGNVWWALKN